MTTRNSLLSEIAVLFGVQNPELMPQNSILAEIDNSLGGNLTNRYSRNALLADISFLLGGDSTEKQARNDILCDINKAIDSSYDCEGKTRNQLLGDWLASGGGATEWTRTLDGLTTYMQLLVLWQLSGAFGSLRVVFFIENGAIQTILKGGNLDVSFGATGIITWSNLSNVEIDGVPATSGVTQLVDGYYTLTGDLDSGADLEFIAAASATPTGAFKTQAHLVEPTDDYDTGNTPYPVNGRDVVELTGVNEYGEIPAWIATNGEIEFQVSPSSFSTRGGLTGGATTSATELSIANVSGNVDLVIAGGVVLSSTALTLDKVSTVKLVKSAGSFELFIDNISQGAAVHGTNMSVDFIGARGWDNKFYLDGFLTNLRLTDLDDSSNNRFYPLDDWTQIQDELGDGSTDGSWTNVIQSGQVYRPNNSMLIPLTVRSADMPTDTNIYNSLGSTGEELVVNGDFSDGSTDWLPSAGITFGASGATFTSVASTLTLRQLAVAQTGKVVDIEIEIENYVEGSIFIREPFNDAPNYFSGNGIFRTTGVAGGSTELSIRAQGTTTLDLVNVSVKETTAIVGKDYNVTTWEPALKGITGEMFLGGGVSGLFTNGVDLANLQITSLGAPTGTLTMTGRENEIITGKNGAQIQITTVVNATTANYIKLGGITDAQITNGIAFPNVPTIA